MNKVKCMWLQVKHGRQAHQLPSYQHRRVCMETCRHAWGAMGVDRALLTCLADRQADQAEAPRIHIGQEGGY